MVAPGPALGPGVARRVATMTALATLGFWAGVIGAGTAVAYWGPRAWARMHPDIRLWVLAGAAAAVMVLIVGGLWAAGQMSTGTPYG